MKKDKVLLAALLLLAATPVLGADTGAADTWTGPVPSAASPVRDAVSRFGILDADHDGWISRSEAMASRDSEARFEQLDTDHNGQVSLSEWQGEADHSSYGVAGVSAASREEGARTFVLIP